MYIIISRFVAFLLAINFSIAEAREIMGLNFCQKVSVDDIKRSLSDSEATVDSEVVDSETGVISVTTKDYKVDKVRTEISFQIYNDKLYRIKLKDGVLFYDIFEHKYGLKKKVKSNGMYITETSHYNSKDPDIDITITYSDLSPSAALALGRLSGDTHSFRGEYLCKGLAKSLSAEEDKIQKSKAKENLRKKGIDKF